MARKQIEWAVSTFLKFAEHPEQVKEKPSIRRKNDTIAYSFKQGDKGVGITWLLHGNRIATIDLIHNMIYLTLAGYPSRITMERLNELCVFIGLKPYAFTGYTTSFKWSVAKPRFYDTLIDSDELIALPFKNFKASLNKEDSLEELIRRKQ